MLKIKNTNMNFENLRSCKKIHFIGIGGIGMSALAFILKEWGIEVQGSDLNESYISSRLKNAEINYFLGHNS